jgi:hypothetical protein
MVATPTHEDSVIWLGLMRRQGYHIYQSFETAIQRSDWVDYSLMLSIEKGKVNERTTRRRMQVTGR